MSEEDYERHVRAVDHLKRAESYYRDGDLRRMTQEAERSVHLDEGLGRSWELIALSRIDEMAFEDAEEAFKKAHGCRGYGDITRRALELMGTMELNEAKGCDSQIERLQALGNHFLSHRLHRAALVCFMRIEAIAEPEWRLYSILGFLHRELSDLGSSLTMYRKASVMEDCPDELKFDLSVVLIKMGRPDEAESILREYNERSPDNPRVWNNLGLILEMRGDLDGALMRYDGAVRLMEDYYPALYSKGRILQQMGRMDEAREVLERALDLEGKVFDISDIRNDTEPGDGSRKAKEIFFDGGEEGE